MYSCRLVTATHCTKTTGPIDIHVPFELCTQVGPSHLTYVATLPCNLSLVAYFADARCGGFFFLSVKLHNLRRNHSVNFLIGLNTAELWTRVCGPTFLAHHPVLRLGTAAE